MMHVACQRKLNPLEKNFLSLNGLHAVCISAETFDAPACLNSLQLPGILTHWSFASGPNQNGKAGTVPRTAHCDFNHTTSEPLHGTMPSDCGSSKIRRFFMTEA